MIRILSSLMFVAFLIVGLVVHVGAFGPGSSYTLENPFSISPGETKVAEVFLSNRGSSDGDKVVRIALEEGSEIASVDSSVSIAKGEEIVIPVRISITEDAAIGTEYPVRLAFSASEEESEGAIGLGLSVDYPFTVAVVAPPEDAGSSNALAWIVGILIVIILIFLLVKAFKKRPIEEIK